MGQWDVRQVGTGQDVGQLASRSEVSQDKGLLSRLGAQIVRPFAAIKEWVGKLLGTQTPAAAVPASAQPALSAADIKQMMLQKALPLTLGGIGKASELTTLTGGALAGEHSRLATGDGALRSLVTALSGIKDGSQRADSANQAAALLARPLGGIPLQQWGTTGGSASNWLQMATPEQMDVVAGQLHAIMDEVAQLRTAVEKEVKGEPVVAQSTAQKPATQAAAMPERQLAQTGYKQALDLISYQASYLLRDQSSLDVTLSSQDINTLQQHISDGSISHVHMDKLQTRGDLQTVRTLALSLAGASDAKGASLGNALDSLASARPNQRLVLGGLMQFAGQTDQIWADKTAGKPEDRLDAGARLRFDTAHMQTELTRLSGAEAGAALQQLEGIFGDRAKAICDFAVAQVSMFADSESSPEAVLVSRLTRMGNLVGSLTDELKTRLQEPQSPRTEPTMIDHAAQLTPLELAALAHIGVDERYL